MHSAIVQRSVVRNLGLGRCNSSQSCHKLLWKGISLAATLSIWPARMLELGNKPCPESKNPIEERFGEKQRFNGDV